MLDYKPFGPGTPIPDTLVGAVGWLREYRSRLTREFKAIANVLSQGARVEYQTVELEDATTLTIRHGLREVPAHVSLTPIGEAYVFLATTPTATSISITMAGNGGDPRTVLVAIFA